jgi:hypothetical protein
MKKNLTIKSLMALTLFLLVIQTSQLSSAAEQNGTTLGNNSCSGTYEKLKFKNEHLDRTKALSVAINDSDFKSLTENRLYNVTDISLNYGLVDTNCNVSDENVQVSFNILNKNGELVECFRILEDSNLTYVISNAIGCGEHQSQPENIIHSNPEGVNPFVIYSVIIGISSVIATFVYIKIHKK